jgi:rubrerythrin
MVISRMTELALRKAGIGGIKGLYKSLSSLEFGRDIGNSSGYAQLKFYCMNCGYEHGENACPKCGSKAVKVG